MMIGKTERHVYKKTDSTLRGNIGVELQALSRAGERLKREHLLGALAGSAGFAACLPRLPELRTIARRELDCAERPQQVLAINGSLSEVSFGPYPKALPSPAV
jgi:hypothetical protein